MNVSFAKTAVLKILGKIEHGFLEVLCRGEILTFGDTNSSLRAMVVVHNEAFFSRALINGEIGFGESFTAGEWSSPDLVSVIRLAVRNLAALDGDSSFISGFRKLLGTLQNWRRRNTPEGSRKNIQHHYDLGNEFYQLFLGSTMAYSCGYFETAHDPLDQAQVQKFDRICRKLRLGPSAHVLEIGTGWGGFAIHAAALYGCRVTTTTISKQQYEYACDWIERSGLRGRVEVLLEDYRKLRGSYDHVVSIEMFEAVGYENYDMYFRICDKLLKPGGTMLLQTITMNEQRFGGYVRDYDWIQKYIFPGGKLASVRGILNSLTEVTGMSLHHAEDIGAHYARTLNAWRRSFHEAAHRLPEMGFDDRFLRMWDYYLAYCEGAFLERHIGDFQLFLTKKHNPSALLDEPWSEGAAEHESRQPEDVLR